jgi:transcriptional regulator with XRE-family HTH domain
MDSVFPESRPWRSARLVGKEEVTFTTPGGFVLHDLLEVKNNWPGGISYQTIATRAGLSKAHVVRLFHGKANPSVETLQDEDATFPLAVELARETGDPSIKDGAGTYDKAKLDRADRLLQAAYPHLLAAFKERAGQEILTALDMQAELDEPRAERVGGIVLDALASIDSDGGTDRG